MAKTYLEFEKPIEELEGKINDLRHLSDTGDVDITSEIKRLDKKIQKQIEAIYTKLDPWKKVQIARHPDRPGFLAYKDQLITDFEALAGDRNFAEDHAIIGGIGRFNGRPVMIIGFEKGIDVESRIKYNFGMARPEGYRKAVRLMNMANQFSLPVISFVDTPGAYPGVGAEERGQAQAIAESISSCLTLKTPMITIIIGEGGSGGAMALAAADRVAMMEHSIYSVISPEGCASILWRDGANYIKSAAEALKITAQDLAKLGIIDEIISEPLGGAHRQASEAISASGAYIQKALGELDMMDEKERILLREEKYLAMGRL